MPPHQPAHAHRWAYVRTEFHEWVGWTWYRCTDPECGFTMCQEAYPQPSIIGELYDAQGRFVPPRPHTVEDDEEP